MIAAVVLRERAYRRLYCEQRLAIGKENPKLSESDYASAPFS